MVSVLFRICTLVLITHAGATAGVDARCPLLLIGTIREESPDLVALFVREPGQPIWSRIYIRNVIEGLRQAFAPHYDGVGLAFEDALRLQHLLTVFGGEMGRGGAPAYTGESGVSPKVWPGQTRAELPYALGRLDLNTIRPRDTPRLSLESERIIAIPEVSPETWPRQRPELTRAGQPTVRHEFVGGPGVRQYLRRMAALMTSLRAFDRDAASADLVETLAEYYFVGVHAHPFYHVNNSVLMAQVNFILNRHLLRGISHGHLDFEALNSADGFGSFRQKFVDAVATANARP